MRRLDTKLVSSDKDILVKSYLEISCVRHLKQDRRWTLVERSGWNDRFPLKANRWISKAVAKELIADFLERNCQGGK